jgi:hypothetical protein
MNPLGTPPVRIINSRRRITAEIAENAEKIPVAVLTPRILGGFSPNTGFIINLPGFTRRLESAFYSSKNQHKTEMQRDREIPLHSAFFASMPQLHPASTASR